MGQFEKAKEVSEDVYREEPRKSQKEGGGLHWGDVRDIENMMEHRSSFRQKDQGVGGPGEKEEG